MMKKIIWKYLVLIILTIFIVVMIGSFLSTTSNIKYSSNLNLNLKHFYKVVDKEYKKINKNNEILKIEYLLIFKWENNDFFTLYEKQKGNHQSVTSRSSTIPSMKREDNVADFKGFLLVHNHPPSNDDRSYSALLPSAEDKESFKYFETWTNTIDSFIYKNDSENSGIFSTKKNVGFQTWTGYFKSLISSNFFVYRLKSNLLTFLLIIIFLLIVYKFWKRKKNNKKILSKNQNE